MPRSSSFPPVEVIEETMHAKLIRAIRFTRQGGSSESRTLPVNSVASLPYSSGTNGAPKGVMMSHVAIGTGAEILRSQIVDVFGPVLTVGDFQITNEKGSSQEHFLLNLPVYHLMGFTLLNASLLGGKFMKKFDDRLCCAMLQKYKIRFLFAHPPQVLPLTKDPLSADYDLTSLRVVDFDTGVEVADGSSFELCVRSPTLMLGYLNRPEATAETIDKDGWLHTGDKAHIDSHGRMWLVGRQKEPIKVLALQVPPTEIEDVLMSHEHVQDAAVVGVPDKERCELIRAYVVRREKNGEESVKAEELLELVKNRLAHYKHITGGLVFVDELPKNGMGKVLRSELKERALRDCELNP